MPRTFNPLASALAAVAVACGSAPPAETVRETRPTRPTIDRPSISPAVESWNRHLSDSDRASKFCKMAHSATAFFRGTNHLFWAAVASDPRLARFSTAETTTWIQGDLHGNNLGAYDNDAGKVVYGLNDFDEAMIADYQYDLWRMAASIALIARHHPAIAPSAETTAVRAFATSYLATIDRFSNNDRERDFVFDVGRARAPLTAFILSVTMGRTRARSLDVWTTVRGEQRRFDLTTDKLAAVTRADREALTDAMPGYLRSLSGGRSFDADYFKIKDVARRHNAGIGSLGTPRYYLLVEGPTAAINDDRILDVKRQSQPTPLQYLPSPGKDEFAKEFPNHAERHARAAKALLVHTDDHLGWLRLGEDDYSVRERSIYKQPFDLDTLTGEQELVALVEQWGLVVAASHARADDDYQRKWVPHSFDREVARLTRGRVVEFADLLVEVASELADRVTGDYATSAQALAGDCAP